MCIICLLSILFWSPPPLLPLPSLSHKAFKSFLYGEEATNSLNLFYFYSISESWYPWWIYLIALFFIGGGGGGGGGSNRGFIEWSYSIIYLSYWIISTEMIIYIYIYILYHILWNKILTYTHIICFKYKFNKNIRIEIWLPFSHFDLKPMTL